MELLTQQQLTAISNTDLRNALIMGYNNLNGLTEEGQRAHLARLEQMEEEFYARGLTFQQKKGGR